MGLLQRYLASLKPLEVEEPIDVYVHRPVAYGVARLIDRRREKARPDWLETSDDEASAL